MRTFKDYILVYLKGVAMGAADVVPGVSGGTIAFIAGIYDELLSSISAINFSLFKTLKQEGIVGVWKKVNGNFLLALVAGIATSILSLAKFITYLLHHHPILIWSFFFGLILASVYYIAIQIKKWHLGVFVGLLIGTFFMYWISVIPPLSPEISYIFLFFAGMLAACAMILPGISGSFILLVIGVYSFVMQAVSDKNILVIATVGAGAVIGLISFSKLLKWLLDNYHNTLLGVLTGFLIGSLWKIWPWKSDAEIYIKGRGVEKMSEITSDYGSLSAFQKTITMEEAENYKSYIEQNILPSSYELLNNSASANLVGAVLSCLFGLSVLFLIELIADKKNSNARE